MKTRLTLELNFDEKEQTVWEVKEQMVKLADKLGARIVGNIRFF